MRSTFGPWIVSIGLIVLPGAAMADGLPGVQSPKHQRPYVHPQRAPAVAAYFAAINGDLPRHRCPSGYQCVVCMAGCDRPAPSVTQALIPRSLGPHRVADSRENDTDGISADAPRFAREEWAGIVCGEESGCRGSSIPPRRDIDVRITYFGLR